MILQIQMKVQYISDIHLELMSQREESLFLSNFKAQAKPADVLLLAGDIGNPFQDSYGQFLALCHQLYPKVFLIAGNHEFYTNLYEETVDKIRSLVEKYPHITFLHKTTEDYQGIRFAGTILWSNILLPQYTINDTQRIREFTTEKYQSLHEESVQWLTQVVWNAKEESMPLVILTHHLPLTQLIHPHYRSSSYAKYNQWFASALDSLVESVAPVLKGWVYGHTHTGSRLLYYSCSFFCNPVGYVGESTGPFTMPMVDF